MKRIYIKEEVCFAGPFGAIRRDTEHKKSVKCDFWPGREMPACVANCPNEALIFAKAKT